MAILRNAGAAGLEWINVNWADGGKRWQVVASGGKRKIPAILQEFPARFDQIGKIPAKLQFFYPFHWQSASIWQKRLHLCRNLAPDTINRAKNCKNAGISDW
jgi:hypothetical protein